VHGWDGERAGAICDGGDGVTCRRCGCGRRRRVGGRCSSRASGDADNSRSSGGGRGIRCAGNARSLRCRGSIVKGVLGAVGDNGRVLRHMLGTNTDEVLQSLLCLLRCVATSDDAVNHVLSKLCVLAVAVLVGVVLALGADLQPGVHASRQNLVNLRGRVGRRWVAGAG